MTEQDFNTWWHELCSRLKPEMRIPYWSVTKGLTAESFVIRHIASNYIQIEGAKNDRLYQRTISAYDFKQVLI